MRVLGLDTATPQSSVALLDDHSISKETVLDPPSPYSNRVLAMVDGVLSAAGVGLDSVDLFTVTRGPGSFTGLRVGMSLLEGMAMVTGKPVMGVDTLEAVAATVTDTGKPICPVLDARKKEIYTAFFRYEAGRLQRVSPDLAIEPERFIEHVQEPTVFVGFGLTEYGDFLAERLGPLFLTSPEPGSLTVAASAARLAWSRLNDAGPDALKKQESIHYLRKSEAEINYLKKHQ